jgi:RHS repeat-associated protein
MGSTMALTDAAGDLVGQPYRYEPYGEGVSGPAVANPIRFQGQYLDSQTGLYKMGLRYYDPTTMRWTQKDPLNLFRDPRQANRYAFAGSDPVNRADPTGQQMSLACYEEQRDLWAEGWGLGGTPGTSCSYASSASSVTMNPIPICLEGAGLNFIESSIWESFKTGKIRPGTPLSMASGCLGELMLSSQR